MSSGTHRSTGGKDTAAESSQQPSCQLPPWATPIVRACDAIFVIFLALAGLCFVLTLALLFVGRVFPWLNGVQGALMFFATLGALAWLIARYDEMAPGWINAVLGAILFFGGAIGIGFLAARGGVESADPFLTGFIGAVRNLGLYLLTISIIRLMIGFALSFMTREQRGGTKRYKYMDTSKKGTEKPGMVPTCWQMSRCRPGVRMTCPNFIDRKTCWKRRSGCFCDRDLANYLVQSVDRKDAQEVIDVQQSTGRPGAAGHFTQKTRRPWKVQKTLCYSCPLFVEHQEYKYKHFSWISLPMTVGIVAGCYSFFDLGYEKLAYYMDIGMSAAVDRWHLPLDPQASSLTTSGSFFEYILLAVLSLILLTYVFAFTETLFLKWKV